MPVARKMELKKKRRHKAKVAYLRKRFKNAKTEDEKNLILDKARKTAPGMTAKQFVAPLKG